MWNTDDVSQAQDWANWDINTYKPYEYDKKYNHGTVNMEEDEYLKVKDEWKAYIKKGDGYQAEYVKFA